MASVSDREYIYLLSYFLSQLLANSRLAKNRLANNYSFVAEGEAGCKRAHRVATRSAA
jgi:hypothetical protein